MTDAQKKQIVSMILDGVPPQAEGAQETGGAALYGSPARAAATPFTGGDLTAMPRSFSGGAVLRAYNPTVRDRIADWLLGDGRPSLYKRQVVSGLLGSTGLGNEGLSLVDVSPFGMMLAGEETGRSLAEGNYGGAAVDALGMLSAPAFGAAVKGVRAFGAKADLPASGGLQPEIAGPLSSRQEMEYDPPTLPQRPVELDYPAGEKSYVERGIADESGRLLQDIDGRPLTARYVAGRTHVRGVDTVLGNEGLARIVHWGTGEFPRQVHGSKIPGANGATEIDLNTGEPRGVLLSADLHPNDISRVLAHETGHVIDQLTDAMSINGIEDEARRNYHWLTTGKAPQPGAKLVGPEDLGYPQHLIEKELKAEAIRGALTGSNYLKTEMPNLAKAVRALNDHPKLKHIIQFNSIAPLMGTGLAGGGGLAGFKESGRGEGEL
ncbi:hypothetical protein GOB46_08620 [Sinorhizobium meliloti]|uniref:hypothetical protein n=7 Tax=Rhizobium meliloti TaxID=382 RepID=UPI00299CE87C|nr:hypothetical protein [Sinorhizobium meliloti]MDW9634633.1 hypothetical protein [Sinorhizobium meliloti]MDW9810217.1 hypothetical protein [Sinorhizobium meliloti]MDW9852651.1 hypothetical protein [Sinorhizobium meliloti]MDW9870845.1 hypothetical protein [Sinorhizobium meliloti]